MNAAKSCARLGSADPDGAWTAVPTLDTAMTVGANTRLEPGGHGDRRPADRRPARPALEVIHAELHGAPGVALRGQIDVAAVPALEPALDTAIHDTTGAFVLDLCELDFLDSSGLGVLLRARALLTREDRALAIVCPPGPVRRLFEVVGIADLLFLYASREEAAAALTPAD